MKKLKKYLVWEFATEVYASLYSICILGVYCIAGLLFKEKTVDIVMIIEMVCVSYVIAFVQNSMFLGNKKFVKKEYKIRVALWHISGNLMAVIAAVVLKWFEIFPVWVMVVYIFSVILLFSVVWIWMEASKNVDTENLNKMLTVYQKKIQLEKDLKGE